MKNINILMLSLLLSISTFVNADNQHNWQSAKSLAVEAAKFGLENDVLTLAKRINRGDFVTNNSYVFMLDTAGVILAHPNRKDIIGSNSALEKKYIKRIISIINQYGEGWIEYHFPNPKTGKDTAKLSYIIQTSPTTLVGAGVY